MQKVNLERVRCLGPCVPTLSNLFPGSTDDARGDQLTTYNLLIHVDTANSYLLAQGSSKAGPLTAAELSVRGKMGFGKELERLYPLHMHQDNWDRLLNGWFQWKSSPMVRRETDIKNIDL